MYFSIRIRPRKIKLLQSYPINLIIYHNGQIIQNSRSLVKGYLFFEQFVPNEPINFHVMRQRVVSNYTEIANNIVASNIKVKTRVVNSVREHKVTLEAHNGVARLFLRFRVFKNDELKDEVIGRLMNLGIEANDVTFPVVPFF